MIIDFITPVDIVIGNGLLGLLREIVALVVGIQLSYRDYSHLHYHGMIDR